MIIFTEADFNINYQMQLKNTLNLIEIYSSVQGETSFSGLPTTFVRLAACNLRCTWCDTPYSFGKGTPWEIDKIIAEIESHGCRYVCITGGEPLLQPAVQSLMTTLCNDNRIVSLETGGSLPTNRVDPRVHVILDIKCPDSGMSEKNYWANLPHLKPQDEVKFVIMGENDYAYAKEICKKYHLFTKVQNVLFSPVHGKLDPRVLIEWILKDQLPVRLNLQIHKYIWTPTTQGV